ncbi:MAG TPA: hypothetical protein VGT79_07600 [Xanthomonadaceae bacterium]|nr:hypothetical protein [Xanthomonadaceae bacterium]
MSDSHNNTSGKRALRSSAILACSIGLVLVLPGTPAMAKGTGLGTLVKAMMGQPVPISANPGNNGSGTTAQGTGRSGTWASSTIVTQPATSSYSPTIMATSSYSQLMMAAVPKGAMAMASYDPATMATASTNPTMMNPPSASATINGSSSIGKHLPMTTRTTSWASSGTVWPSASLASRAPYSSGKGPSMPKPATLATWPAVDASASSAASRH